MRKPVWILLSVAVIAVSIVFLVGEDPDPPVRQAAGRDHAGEPGVTAATGRVEADPSAALSNERAAATTVLTEYDRLLQKSATGYTGRVVSAAGEPVPGIGVALIRVSATAALPHDLDVFSRTPAAPRLVAARALTDRAGRFALTGVAPRGLCVLELEFADVEAAPARFRSGDGTHVPVQQTPAPGEVVDLGDVTLKTGATLVGRVVDLDGPVDGALVRAARLPPLPFGALPLERLRPDGGLIGTPGGGRTVLEFPEWFTEVWESLPIAATHSRGDGTFTLHGVDPGTVVVAATAASHSSCLKQNVTALAGGTTTLGDLFLPYGSTTRVEVFGGDGEPVAGARVLVAPMSVGVPAHVAEPAGTTNADGIVEVEGLPVGRAMAAAQRPGDTAWHVGEPGSAEGRLRVVIPERHSLTLLVRDGVGRTIERPRVRLVAGDRDHGVLELSLFGAREATELGGRMERLEDGRLRIAGLAAGEWTLVVGAPGFATKQDEVELSGDEEIVVELRSARELRVRTIDAAGEPVKNATLYSKSRHGSRAERIVQMPLAVGRTDVDGWCRIADLPTPQTRLTAMHPELGQVHAEVNGHPRELVMQFQVPASIRGVLTDGGRPPAPGRWVLVLERRYGDGPLRRGAMPEIPQLAVPDLEGRFRFAALQPGKWRVTAQDSVADVSTIAGLYEYTARRKQIYPWNKAEVLLSGGENVEVSLDAIVDAAPFDGPGAPVRGSVTINGLPAVDALVVGTSKKPERRVTSRVDRGGWFDLGKVPAGELRVVVVPAEVAASRLKEHIFTHLYARDFEVAADRPLELAIAIATGELFGEVRDSSGAAVSDCRVWVHDRGGDGHSSALRTTRTDRFGRFAFTRLPAGNYQLRAENERRRADVPGIAVAAGGVVGPVDVRLARLAKLTGRLLFEEPLSPRPVVLVLHGPTTNGRQQRRMRSDAAFEFREIPVGTYRAEVRIGRDVKSAGAITVSAPETTDVVLRVSG